MRILSAQALTGAPPLVVREGRGRAARTRLARAAAHMAAWSPFVVSAADSLRSRWHAVGDGAMIALGAWATFSRHIPLLGQPTDYQRGLHDLGPAEYWLLAIPVHIDPERGLVWGAALLCLAAVSLVVEAAWSVLGEAGGMAASGMVLAMTAWMPAIAVRPYWNPYFGAIWFLAAIAACWAVMSGHCRWWPALAVSASIAAQAHLMFALASAGLALMAFIVTGADGFRTRTGYRGVMVGILAGEACWLAPLYQQISHSPGNMSVLIQVASAGRHSGLAFGMKALAAFTEPPPLWWRPHLGYRPELYRVIEARPAAFALAVLAITAAVVALAVFRRRSRRLASLSAISLLISTAAVVTFSGVPPTGPALSRVSYLTLSLFPAGLLTWLTAGSAVVLACRDLITRRRRATTEETEETEEAGETAETPAERPRTSLARLAACGAWAVPAVIIMVASLLGLAQSSGYSGAGQDSGRVGVASRLIERELPGRQALALSVAANSAPVRYHVTIGLIWALTAQGYDPRVSGPEPGRRGPHVTVLIAGRKVIVAVAKRSRRSIAGDRRG